MLIGKFHKVQEGVLAYDLYEGSILISEWRGIPVTISEVTAKIADGHPDFVVSSLYDGEEYEIGAGWRRSSAKGKPYVSLQLDAPTLPAPIDCALIRQTIGDYNLVWSRDHRKETELAAPSQAQGRNDKGSARTR
jgi:uncharacterized protein (DUF736 family)